MLSSCSLESQVLATEQLGQETAFKLKQQTDQMVNIHKNVDLIESDLQRADKIVLLPGPRIHSLIHTYTHLNVPSVWFSSILTCFLSHSHF